MKPHLKKEILEFKELNGSLYTGCNCGLIVLDKTLYYLKCLYDNTTKQYFKGSLNLKKLRTFKDMEQYSQDHDTIKIGNQYFSAFRLYALLSKVEYKKGEVEIYSVADSRDYPILIKANDKEMFLAPIIIQDYPSANCSWDNSSWVKTIPSIESFSI